MTICYSYMLSLFGLLVITHWADTASLPWPSYSSVNHHQNYSLLTSDYFKSDSQLLLIKRLKRWITLGDNDEVEIPLDESLPLTNTSNDTFTLSSLVSSTVSTSETTIIEHTDDLSNSTLAFPMNMTTFSDENTTIRYPLLRQDLNEVNQTTIVYTEDVSHEKSTIFLPTVSNTSTSISTEIMVTTFPPPVINDKNQSVTANNLSTEYESSSVSIIHSQTTDQADSVTFFHHTTVFNKTNVDDETNEWNFLFTDKTESIPSNVSFTNTITNEFSINSNISQKDALIIDDHEIYTNASEITMIDTIQSSNDSVVLSLEIPICDASCHCLKECLYGFEILNDTCLCNPPCNNYQCFGNDTCIITEEGHPLCQPENGTEHDRPTRCYQPRDAGYHDTNIGYQNRWYYNPDQDTCHLFVYRGLGGNENNFHTLHECYSECITCAPLPDPGECLGRINMWYYDNKKNECREFEYSGCKGNENKFVKKEQCVNICINRIPNL